jgi:hypothetical protein
LEETEADKTIFIEIPHFPAEDLVAPKDPQDILVVAGRGTKVLHSCCGLLCKTNSLFA